MKPEWSKISTTVSKLSLYGTPTLLICVVYNPFRNYIPPTTYGCGARHLSFLVLHPYSNPIFPYTVCPRVGRKDLERSSLIWLTRFGHKQNKNETTQNTTNKTSRLTLRSCIINNKKKTVIVWNFNLFCKFSTIICDQVL